MAILGNRLAPWRGRLDDLPVGMVAVDGHARRARAAMLAEAATAATATGRAVIAGGSRASSETRAAARNEMSRVLRFPR